MKTRGMFKPIGTLTINGETRELSEHKLNFYRWDKHNIPAKTKEEAERKLREKFVKGN